MLLSDFLAFFIDNHETGIRKSTIECHYKPAIASLERHLARKGTVNDMNRDTVNVWLNKEMERNPDKRTTIDNRRRAFLTLWRAACKYEFVETGPDRIRRVGKPKLVVQAWTREELQRLLDYTEALPGRMKNSPLSQKLFWQSLALAAYETGLRLGDLLSIERDWIRVDRDGFGYFTMIQSKTQIQKASRLTGPTMALIDRLMSESDKRRLIWSLGVTRNTFYRQWKKIVLASGVRPGTFRWLRRSATTHVEAQQPGCGYRIAGHVDQRVTIAHYLDRSQLQDEVIQPIPLRATSRVFEQLSELAKLAEQMTEDERIDLLEYAKSMHAAACA